MSIIELHGRLANTALLYFGLIALWGFWRYFRRQGVGPSYWGALVIAEVLIVIQGAIGAYLWLDGGRPDRGVHILYGVASALALPLAYSLTRGRAERPEALIYATTALVTAGMVIRAITTAG